MYDELTKYTCQTFDDVKAKALAHVRLEEDRLSRTRLESCRRSTNGRTQTAVPSRPSPYSRSTNVYTVPSKDTDGQEHPDGRAHKAL